MPGQTLERVDSAASIDPPWEGYFYVHPSSEHNFATKHVLPRSENITEMDSSLTLKETIDLVDGTVETARQSMQQSLSGSERVRDTVQLKLTIDLGHKGIGDLPDEVIDIFRRDIERLVLSHNQIPRIPNKFAECNSLTYLNLRANRLTEFPKAVHSLLDLQILDLSRNSIRRIPEEIRNMRALRVFSVTNNKIEDVPFVVGFLESLQIIRLSNNPLNNGLRGILNSNDISTSDVPTPVAENEKETWLTRKIKNHLKSEAMSLESGGESSESPLDTPRPLKRNVSLRFPIVLSTSGSEASSDLRSPAFGKSLMSQRHYRVASGQTSAPPNAALRRPGLTPLTIGNERNRSNSESILQASQNARNKRMGMVSRKNSELGTLSEAKTQRDSAHFRGFSHSSVLHDSRDNQIIVNTTERLNAAGAVEIGQTKGTFIRRLSSLPEHKSEISSSNSFIESAKGVLYSLHQVHPHVSTLLIVLRTKSTTTSSLEGAYSQAAKGLNLLDLSLHRFEQSTDRDASRDRAIVQVGYRCRVCLLSYQDVGKLLLDHTTQLVVNSDQRYLRTWLILIFGNLVEARNACFNLGFIIKDNEKVPNQVAVVSVEDNNKHPAQRESSAPSPTPTKEHSLPTRRVRNENSSKPDRAYGHMQTNTHSAVPLYINGRSRSNSRTNASVTSNTSSIVNTPRSGETFLVPETPLTSAGSYRNLALENPRGELDILFERICLDFNQSIELGLQVIPNMYRRFHHCLDVAKTRYVSGDTKSTWKRLILHCQYYLEECEFLKKRLANVSLNDPDRMLEKFWVSCGKHNYILIDIVEEVRRNIKLIGPDILRALQPVYKSVKVTAVNLRNSPWGWVNNRDLLPKVSGPTKKIQAAGEERFNGSGKSISSSHQHSQTGSWSSSSHYGSSVPMTPVPATPLSAALGPAAQATVPNTPSNLPINFFERLEAYNNSMQSNPHNRH